MKTVDIPDVQTYNRSTFLSALICLKPPELLAKAETRMKRWKSLFVFKLKHQISEISF
jgi:hypothetical protein